MNTKHLNGMRNIATIQSRSGRSARGKRRHTATELVRFEHELARLEREMRILVNHRQRIEERIHDLEGRLNNLQQMIETKRMDLVQPDRPHGSPRDTSSSHQKSTGEQTPQVWQEFVLEY